MDARRIIDRIQATAIFHGIERFRSAGADRFFLLCFRRSKTSRELTAANDRVSYCGIDLVDSA